MEQFLNHGSETRRSLSDPWELQGDTLFNADVLLQRLLLKAGECAPLFSNVATFYNMSRIWWESHAAQFQRQWNALAQDYNPQWTNDSYRTIEEHTKNDGQTSVRTAGNASSSNDGKTASISHAASDTVSRSDSTTKGHDGQLSDKYKNEQVNTVSAYDSSSYSPHDKSEGKGDETAEHKSFSESKAEAETISNTENTAGTAQIGHASSKNEGTSDTINEQNQAHDVVEHTYGNNSVMKTGPLLMTEEIKARQLDLYNLMCDCFCSEMLVWVYT